MTPEIQTSDFYPFNQTPGQTQSAFVSRFTLTSFAGEAEASPSEGETKKPEFLLINEVLYDSAESDSDGNVFVELYGGAGGDLAGYVLRLVNGADGAATDEIVFPVGSLIPDDGFFVVADSKTGNASETNVANADFIDNFDPQNGPDSIQLLNASGVLIDVVGYGEGLFASDADDNLLYEGSPAQTAGVGKSLSRVAATDTGNNSADFVANETPSPGNGDVSGPENSNAVASSEQTDISIDSTADAEDSIPPDFNAVHFTEVVTDPQQDWNDTLGGNGIAFDSTVGNGTVGTTDEWVEIQNGTLDSVDLTLWRLEMLDGTDEMEYFSSPSASLIFTAGGDGGNFQPDEFLVIGNPPGDLKNVVTLQLFDESDFLVDELVIDDANATGTADESYQIMDDGNWGMGEASIGF